MKLHISLFRKAYWYLNQAEKNQQVTLCRLHKMPTAYFEIPRARVSQTWRIACSFSPDLVFASRAHKIIEAWTTTGCF